MSLDKTITRGLMAFGLAAVGLGVGVGVGVSSAPASAQATPPSAQDTAAQDIAWHSAQQLALAQRAASGEWSGLGGGLMWRRIAGDGSGAHPTVSDYVTVHYHGTFIDGRVFDSSFDRGQPATFPLGALIKAWQIAIPKMGVGDTIEIASPAALAYGPVGKGPIPGGATLIFKVELIAINPPQ